MKQTGLIWLRFRFRLWGNHIVYLYDAAINAIVGVPQAPVVPPLPDGPLRGLGAAFLQHGVHRKDALSGQTWHQLTANTRTPRLEE